MTLHRMALVRVLIGLCLLASLSPLVLADDSHDRTQFGHNITIGPGETASDVTCFGCSVRVRGRVDSDVTTFFGSVVIEGEGRVGGDTTVFAGDVRLERGASVQEVDIFGGELHRDPGATVAGDVTDFHGGWWMLLILGLPLIFLGGFIALIIWLVRMATRPRVPVAA